jgi:hypothetical protein
VFFTNCGERLREGAEHGLLSGGKMKTAGTPRPGTRKAYAFSAVYVFISIYKIINSKNATMELFPRKCAVKF